MTSKNKDSIGLRQELKYKLPESDKNSLSRYLKLFMVEDPCMTSSEGYFVSSLYFDSADMMCLSQKINGDLSKIKFRIRHYDNNSSSSFLEVKKKTGTFSSKSRALCRTEPTKRQEDPQELLNFLNSLKAENLSTSDFMYYYHKYTLKPILWVHFRRAAYICPYGSGLRLTIDSSLRGQFFSLENPANQNTICFGGGLDILEIKWTNTTPLWLDLFLKETEIEKVAFSKYYECYSALQGALRFQPVINGPVKDY